MLVPPEVRLKGVSSTMGSSPEFLFKIARSGILLATHDGTILDANPAAAAILRRRREDIIAAGLDGVFDPSDSQARSAMEEQRRTGRSKGELRMLSQGGIPFSAEVSIGGYRDKEGQERVGIVFRDAHEGKGVEGEIIRANEQLENKVKGRTTHFEALVEGLDHYEEKLRESEERYKLVAKGVSDGIWEWDVRTGAVFWNDRLLEMLDLPPSEFTATLEGTLEFVHPEDKQELEDAIVAALERNVPMREVLFCQKLRLRHSTGEYRTCITHGRAQYDRNGALLRVIGIMVDTNKHGREAEALRESEERFRATFDLAGVGIAHVAPDGRWLRVNQKLCGITGFTREELLRKTSDDITHPDDLDRYLEGRRRILANETDKDSFEKRYVKKDRTQAWVNVTLSLVRESPSKPCYFAYIAEDITERRYKRRLLDRLTSREIEVLQLLAQGLTNAEIAKNLNFSVGTAKVSVRHIIVKLEVSDRTQAAVLAVEGGLVLPNNGRALGR